MNNKKILTILGVVIVILLVISGVYIFIDSNNRNKSKTIICTKTSTERIKISTEVPESNYDEVKKIIIQVKNNNQVVKIDYHVSSKYSDKEAYLWMKGNVIKGPNDNLTKYNDEENTITSEINFFDIEGTDNKGYFITSEEFTKTYIEDGYTCDN